MAVALQSAEAVAQSQETAPATASDGWALTDALGRKAASASEASARRDDRYVAMFYWTWHQGTDRKASVRNITEVLRQHPEAIKDFNHPAWGVGDERPGNFYWEQPLLGYYRTTDPWVLRKHAEMLADAGVDVVFFDCTNGSLTWEDSYEALFKTWQQALEDGVNVPKVAFMLPFAATDDSRKSLRQLYRDVYSQGRYPDLWFYWKGKPVIMAYPDNLVEDDTDRRIAEFFTFRPGQPDYVNGPGRDDQWAWLENYPQNGYAQTGDGGFEEVTVGVAQNAGPMTHGHCSAFNLPGTFSRSFSQRNGFDPRMEGYLYGWNFQEQWDRAREIDPELVFVTGWNEFTAGMWRKEHGWSDPLSFVDQYNWDCSRDIEPNKGWGDRGDVYYVQLVDNVRRFKGMTPPETASAPKSIRLGAKGEWDDVTPRYTAYRGNTFHRDHDGAYNTHYTDNSGRNDIVAARVAHDADNLYFYVETADKLTPSSDPAWMQLFIDADRSKDTGWAGYDFVINRVSPSAKEAVVERCSSKDGSWLWETAGKAAYKVSGNVLEIAVPKRLLGFDSGAVDFEFKWNDNMQYPGSVMDFYVSGDTAPGGRFNYVYRSRKNDKN
ncbi:MAG: hypothetical protein K2L90_09370 [Muribaculaceae bacterium]|nr:hypothetical protein [Muribaculaceae bacterium]